MAGTKGESILYLVVAGGVAYGLYKFFKSSQAIQDTAEEIWETITFDKASMGPKVQLTESAQLSHDEYVRRGYIATNPRTGMTYITPEGEAYIQRMREAQAREVSGIRL